MKYKIIQFKNILRCVLSLHNEALQQDYIKQLNKDTYIIV